LEAESLMSALFAEGMSQEEVLESIRDRAGLASAVRAQALSLAQTYPDSPVAMNSRSWSVVKDPGRSEREYTRALRQAQTAVDAEPKNPEFLNTLGAALYRARRFAEAINRLEQGIKLRSGSSDAFDWAFLAMAHARHGQRDEALRWLDRFLDKSHPGLDNLSGPLEIRPLRYEAQVVVLYDSVFPADPFGH
jgi:tetratricopeptide (TPR) repeat protein